MSEPQITHSAKPTNTTTQTAAERLRASAERDRALADAATPGPWYRDSPWGGGHAGWVCIDPCGVEYKHQMKTPDDATADFIAASRVIVPRQAEQIQVLVEALEEQRDWLERHYAVWADDDPFGQDCHEQMANIDYALDAAWALEGDDA